MASAVKYFQTAETTSNPLIRPVGHLLPLIRGEGTSTTMLKPLGQMVHTGSRWRGTFRTHGFRASISEPDKQKYVNDRVIPIQFRMQVIGKLQIAEDAARGTRLCQPGQFSSGPESSQ
jgi:aryl-alcohol dehydrogenase-like predicted oxidoreductase